MNAQTELQEGDIYRWEWIDPPDHEPYWGKTQRALVINGKLFDLFRVHHGSRFIEGGWGPSCSRDDALPVDDIHITLIANINHMNEIPHGDEKYYDPDDVIDLRNSNNSLAPLYTRNGAVKSAKKIEERIRDKLNKAESDREFLDRKIKDLQEKLAHIESGGSLDKFWF